MTDQTFARTILPGLRFENTPKTPWKLTAENVGVLSRIFGNDLFNAFVRCFAVSDRLATIVDCVALNADHRGVDTIRGTRNLRVLALFSVGLVYELREGLQQLREIGVDGRLGADGKERWAKLVAFADLKNEDTMCQLRNCLAFHLGDECIVDRGIAHLLAEPEELELATGDGTTRIDVRHDFVLQVLLAGIRIRPPGVKKGTPNSRRRMTATDVDDAVKEARDCHFMLVSLLEEIFHDALRQAGGDLPPLGPIDPENDLPAEDGDR